MIKTKTKEIIGFAAEIIFFVSTGGYIANRNWGLAALSLIFAMVFAGWTGQQIKKGAIEKDKEKKKIKQGWWANELH